MKSINNHNEQLKSIDFAEDDEACVRYLEKTIRILAENSSSISFKVALPNYSDDQLMNNLYEYIINNKLFEIEANTKSGELYMYLKSQDINNPIVEIMSKFWQVYEQYGIIIYFNENLSFGLKKSLHLEFWETVIMNTTCFIIFKSVEENVIWTGKSATLEFDNVCNM